MGVIDGEGGGVWWARYGRAVSEGQRLGQDDLIKIKVYPVT